MTPEQYAEVCEAFSKVNSLTDSERDSYLSDLARERPEIHVELMAMLECDPRVADSMDGFDDAAIDGAQPFAGQLLAPESEAAEVGDALPVLEPYEIRKVLGQGGMGTVYLCDQTHPVKRQVAVKLIRAGMDTVAITTRFELERQALERMEHPGIARLLDAGTSAEGRPFFVVEFVDGADIVTHCDKNKLSIAQRLKLFASSLRALQHAHLRGVLHRDLKPSNILVSEAGESAQPKIIDFGLARAVDPGEESPLSTLEGQVIGTPAYMSPEQLQGSRADVDVRSDVFSMGALLFELLTGTLPFESSSGGAAAILERLKQLGDTPIPSSRVKGSKHESSRHADTRSVTPGALAGALKGELDWVVVKAMAAAPEDRYESAAEFADDIDAFLTHRPLQAGPPEFTYRARKFVRRHRVWLAAGSLATLSMLAGVISSARGARLAREGQIEAEAAGIELQAALDDTSAQYDVLNKMLTAPDPRFRGKDTSVKDLMAYGSEYALEKYADRPRVMTEILGSLGANYRELGMNKEAEPLLRQAIEYQLEFDDQDYLKIAFKENGLAILLKRMNKLEEAEALYRSAIKHCYMLPNGREFVDAGAWEFNLARLLLARGEDEEAEKFLNDSLDTHLRNGAENSVGCSLISMVRADLLKKANRHDEAETALRTAIKRFQSVEPVPQHYVISAKQQLCSLLVAAGRLDEALPLALESLDEAVALYGEKSSRLLPYLNAAAVAYLERGEPEESEALLLDAMDIAREFHEPYSIAYAGVQRDLAACLIDLGREEEALDLLKEVLEAYSRQGVLEESTQMKKVRSQIARISDD